MKDAALCVNGQTSKVHKMKLEVRRISKEIIEKIDMSKIQTVAHILTSKFLMSTLELLLASLVKPFENYKTSMIAKSLFLAVKINLSMKDL